VLAGYVGEQRERPVSVRGPVERAAREAGKRVLQGAVRRLASRREDLPLATWDLARDAKGALSRTGVPLGGLLDRWGSPLHVVDEGRLLANATAFMTPPPGAPRGCEVFYSYKTNPIPEVLRRLHGHGVGAEVASGFELWLALRLGVDPRAIVFDGPARSDEATELALRRGVGLVNVNARTEIGPLAALARRLGVKVPMGIRVVVPGFQGGPFGERIDTGAALAAFREALTYPELEVTGMHSHANGRIDSAAVLDALLSGLLRFADELHERLRLDLQVLDVGGNLACPTVVPFSARARRLAVACRCEPEAPDPCASLSIQAYVKQVVERVEAHFTGAGRSAPRIFVEPGRAMTSNAQMLLCRVAALRDDAEGLAWAVLDAGINVAEALRSEIHQLLPLAPHPGARERVYRLSGPSCTLGDLLYPAWRLPELAVGDALAAMDTGAYFVPYSTCFSFPRPGVVLLTGGHAEIIRRSETYDDLVALDGRNHTVANAASAMSSGLVSSSDMSFALSSTPGSTLRAK
jgi:diaminopimelate decarboxylase